MSTSIQYWLIINQQAYSLLGTLLNISRSSSFTYLAVKKSPIAAIVLISPFMVATWVAAIIFYTLVAVNWRIPFNYIFLAFIVIAKDYTNYSTDYAKPTLEADVSYSVLAFFLLFFTTSQFAELSQ